MGEFGSSARCREEKANSGESSLERWLRKRGFQGASPSEAGVVDCVDMVRRMRCKREAAEEAILKEIGISCRE